MQNMAQNFYSPNTQFYTDRMRNIAGYNSYNPYSSQFQPTQTQQSQQNMIPCRPVTSAKEAEAAIIDAFSPHIFTNFAGNEIYAKYIQNDGTAKFEIFKKVLNQNNNQGIEENSVFNSNININEMKKEFEDKIENLNMQIIQLNKEIVSLKMGGKEKQNDEHIKSSTSSKNSK